MTLNKTKIEWCDYTWNPVTGCKHGCSYCYARKIAERFKGSKAWPQGFKPMFHPERLSDPAKWKQPQAIFVCSMADLFGEWIPDHWLRQIFDECVIGYQHTYLFLTKNPKRYLIIPGEYIRKNRWFGTTVTDAKDAGERIHWLQRLPEGNTFISFEPLLDDLGPLDLSGIKQVIIGAQTNPYIPPPGDAVRRIVRAAHESGTKVFFKNSMAGVHWVGESTYINNHELCWSVNK